MRSWRIAFALWGILSPPKDKWNSEYFYITLLPSSGSSRHCRVSPSEDGIDKTVPAGKNVIFTWMFCLNRVSRAYSWFSWLWSLCLFVSSFLEFSSSQRLPVPHLDHTIYRKRATSAEDSPENGVCVIPGSCLPYAHTRAHVHAHIRTQSCLVARQPVLLPGPQSWLHQDRFGLWSSRNGSCTDLDPFLAEKTTKRHTCAHTLPITSCDHCNEPTSHLDEEQLQSEFTLNLKRSLQQRHLLEDQS